MVLIPAKNIKHGFSLKKKPVSAKRETIDKSKDETITLYVLKVVFPVICSTGFSSKQGILQKNHADR